jgi:hypothetical protein
VNSTLTSRTLRFSALGYVYDVSGDTDLLARAEMCFRDLASPPEGSTHPHARYELRPGAEEGVFRLLCNGNAIVEDSTPAHVLSTLLWHVNAEATQRRTSSHVVLHAAAAARNGQAVVLPAPMQSGKTTLVAGLVSAGFAYLTDEASAVSVHDHHVEPFHKSLSVDQGSWPFLESLAEYDAGGLPSQWQVPVGSLPTARLAARTPLRFVVLPRYNRGSRTSLEPISRAAAVLGMAGSTFQFKEEPHWSLDELAQITRAAECFRLTIGSLDEAVALISDLMGAA